MIKMVMKFSIIMMEKTQDRFICSPSIIFNYLTFFQKIHFNVLSVGDVVFDGNKNY